MNKHTFERNFVEAEYEFCIEVCQYAELNCFYYLINTIFLASWIFAVEISWIKHLRIYFVLH